MLRTASRFTFVSSAAGAIHFSDKEVIRHAKII